MLNAAVELSDLPCFYYDKHGSKTFRFITFNYVTSSKVL